FHQAHAVVAVDDRRNAVVRRDLEEVRLELLVLGNVDRVRRVGQAELLQRDGDLAAVRRGPGVEVDHGALSLCWSDDTERREQHQLAKKYPLRAATAGNI